MVGAVWLVMLAATVTGIAVLIRAELLFRRLERDAHSDVPETGVDPARRAQGRPVSRAALV
ncbi:MULTISPECIES: hypothetical protein [unclassified Streptomyces]|uniref:hypothetical protein n=1 Tax=unclassified Streptomyces TaxID=2593676 RepID=UPI003431D37F